MTDDHHDLDGTSLVWIDAWQLQCCGMPFRRGGPVSWTLATLEDREWMTALLGPDLGSRVSHVEEHHGGLPADAPVTTAVAARIRAVSCVYDTSPVPGTATVDEVTDADGWYPDPDGLQFAGYLVDLEPTKG